MSTPQLILTRYTELIGAGNIDPALAYLSEDVIYCTWLGVVEGKSNVTTFLRDNVRYLHHSRNYNQWHQVHHSFNGAGHGTGKTAGEDAYPSYDKEGYATFERNGKLGYQPKIYVRSVPVKETVVIRDGLIVLVNVTKRL